MLPFIGCFKVYFPTEGVALLGDILHETYIISIGLGGIYCEILIFSLTASLTGKFMSFYITNMTPKYYLFH